MITSDVQLTWAISQLRIEFNEFGKPLLDVKIAQEIIMSLMENEALLRENEFRINEMDDQWSRAETIINIKGVKGVEELKGLLKDYQRKVDMIQKYLETIE